MVECYSCGTKITKKNFGRVDKGFYSTYVTCKKCAMEAGLPTREYSDLRVQGNPRRTMTFDELSKR
jgi:hypothetical protein